VIDDDVDEEEDDDEDIDVDLELVAASYTLRLCVGYFRGTQ